MKCLLIFSLSAIVILGCKFNNGPNVSKRPNLTIFTYGLNRIDYDVQNLIARKYGLVYEQVGGCTETEEFIDSIKKLNQKTYVVLSKEFGPNWSTELRNEIDSIGRLTHKAKHIVEIKTDYSIQTQIFRNNHDFLFLYGEPTETEYIFLVQAYTSQGIGQDAPRKVYKEWKVDVWNWKIIDSLGNYR